MAVYVDEMRLVLPGLHHTKPFRVAGAKACHMMADTDEELEAFAAKLGLRKNWRHGDHYDLTPNKRREAVNLGAVEIRTRDMVRMRHN